MKEFISKIVRRWKAYRYNVPFRNKVWYHYMAMLPKKERVESFRKYLEE